MYYGGIMIGTSSYKGWQSDVYTTYSISDDCGKKANYRGKSYPDLAPKTDFVKKWHDNIGIIPDELNDRYYVQEYWTQVLSQLDPESVYRDLDFSILLCYETNAEFCHRHIIAAWFEILLGVEVPEMLADGLHTLKTKRPDYIKGYLEDAMRYNRNMRGFTSLRALYLFEKGDKLEEKADRLEKETGKNYDGYRQTACYLRCEADLIEEKYQRSLQEVNLSR